jgi:hypothetical protein
VLEQMPEEIIPGVNYGAIARIECVGETGWVTGTVFQIAPGKLVTAAHVTMNRTCSISGAPVEKVREDGTLDVAELKGPDIGSSVEISCEGLKPFEHYIGVGYALGIYRHSARLVATTQGNKGVRVWLGTIYKGQSGGPAFDPQGRAAGVVIHTYAPFPASGGRALSDTWLCEDKA